MKNLDEQYEVLGYAVEGVRKDRNKQEQMFAVVLNGECRYLGVWI
jgi:hypothetical protein